MSYIINRVYLFVKPLLAVIGVTTSVAAYKYRDEIVQFFIGPGSYFRIFTLLVVLANYKGLPFVYTVCLWCLILSRVNVQSISGRKVVGAYSCLDSLLAWYSHTLYARL